MLSPGLYIVQLPAVDIDAVPQAVEAYAREAETVAYAEPDYMAYTEETLPNDPRFSELHGLHNTDQSGGTTDADIDAPEAWDLSTGGNLVVGIIDTGIDYAHEDLAANMTADVILLGADPVPALEGLTVTGGRLNAIKARRPSRLPRARCRTWPANRSGLRRGLPL